MLLSYEYNTTVTANLCLLQDLHEDKDVTSMSCDGGHPGNMLLGRLSGVLFNVFAKNEAKNMNSAIDKMKKRGQSNRRGGSEARKIQKLHNYIVLVKTISYVPITKKTYQYFLGYSQQVLGKGLAEL